MSFSADTIIWTIGCILVFFFWYLVSRNELVYKIRRRAVDTKGPLDQWPVRKASLSKYGYYEMIFMFTYTSFDDFYPELKDL